MKERLQKIHTKVDAAIHSSNGRNLLLYLMFVVVAFCFWMMLSLDTEVQREFEVPLELTDVPDSITVINELPTAATVSIRGKGVQLIRFSWGKMAPLKIDFRNYVSKDGRLLVTRSRLDSRLREYFGTGMTISSIKPDSIVVNYTSKPGKLVKLKIIADIHPDIQCIVSGPIKASTDSVMVYSANPIPADLVEIETEPIVATGLKDTSSFDVMIKPLPGMRIIPDHIIITVPVEPLISKKREVMVDVLNTPAGERVLTFPSKIEVSYLVPMSRFNDEFPVSATVDYVDTYLPGDLVPVKLSATPSYYHNVTFSPDSVEYLIEKN